MHIDILNIGSDLEAIALRGVLEYWGHVVTVRHLPTSKHLVRCLDGSTPLAEFVVLVCHGGEQGLELPELAPEIAAQQPYQGAVSAKGFREFLRLPGKVVLCTGCLMGTAEMGAAFLGAGCKAYIGPGDYPDGDAAMMYALELFFGLSRGQELESAHRVAISRTEADLFRFYQQA